MAKQLLIISVLAQQWLLLTAANDSISVLNPFSTLSIGATIV
jgi:hypothetical protein